MKPIFSRYGCYFRSAVSHGVNEFISVFLVYTNLNVSMP